MIDKLCAAISNQSIIQFTYKSEIRIVEPHCYGITTAGNYGLRAYQIDGYSSSGKYGWKMYDLGKATYIEISSDYFYDIRPGYKQNDKGMSKIFCQL